MQIGHRSTKPWSAVHFHLQAVTLRTLQPDCAVVRRLSLSEDDLTQRSRSAKVELTDTDLVHVFDVPLYVRDTSGPCPRMSCSLGL